MAKKTWKIKACPRCDLAFRDCEGNKYCESCREEVKRELADSGFLQKTQRGHTYRHPDQKQAGSDPGPWQENAVRSMEGD